MTTDTIACPYCNALVSVTPGANGGQRVPCQRCGESFALPTFTTSTSADIGTRPTHGATVATGSDFERPIREYAKPVQANRRLGLLILAVMVCMGGGTLVFAIATEAYRRANDKGITKQRNKRRPPLDDVTPGDVTPTAPAKLEALAWLPPDTNVVLGVHLREVAASEAGKSFLKQPIKAGEFDLRISIEALADWTGFKHEEIEHLVLGIKADEAILPRATLIVRTRQEYDEKELVDRLKAERTGVAGTRAVYEYQANKKFKPSVCRLDSRTVAYGLLPHHLRDIPTTPRTDIGQLPREMREVLKTRVGPIGPLWVAGHSDDWSRTQLRLLFGELNKPDRDRLVKIRTFAAWVQPDDPMLVQAAFDCGDETTAKELQMYFKIPEEGGDPDWKASRADGWLSVQIRTTPDKVREALER